MKICLINNLYKPFSKGGAEAVVENTVKGLMSLKYEVILITLGEEYKIEELDGVKIYRIKPWNIFSFLDIDKKSGIFRFVWWFFNVFSIFSYVKIKKILKQEKPNAIHMHNLTGIGFLIPRLIKKLNIKSILTLHDIQLAYPLGQLIYDQENKFINIFFLRQWYEKLIKFLISSPNVVISPSKWLLDFYIQKGFFKNSNKEVLVNPVFKISGEKIKSKELKFLYVGQIEKYKGILILLNVFKDLNYKLNIVGNGKDLEKAKKFGSNNIFFYGKLNKKELEKIYLKSDILIFPSLTYENYPTVILEAFSFGIPVIASKIGGVPELVEHNFTGWLFEPGNRQELKNLILLNKDNLNEIKENCLKKARKYIVEEYLEQLKKIYI